MTTYYTKDQIDAQAVVIGSRIKSHSSGSWIVTQIANENDANLITDAERARIASIPDEHYRGLYTAVTDLPAGNAGDYADVDAGQGSDVSRYIWDADDSVWVQQGAGGGSETASSIKSKYESNSNTNAFTDDEKSKLAGISDVEDLSAFTSALDAALA